MGCPDRRYPGERRSGKDRRARPTAPLTRSSLSGSREYIRRKEDRNRHIYVDRYKPGFLLIVSAALVLCVADGLFTLELISRGASELNPIMSFFLQFGPLPFLLVKYALTAFGLTMLVIHQNYAFLNGRIGVRSILVGALVMYATLIAYEMTLIL